MSKLNKPNKPSKVSELKKSGKLKNPKILCVIPSRIGSTRLPRKPVLPIQGKPMIQWVYQNAARCQTLNKVVVATDVREIADIIESIGGEALMFTKTFLKGTDCVAWVAEQYPDMDVIINLQGDEPFIKPKMLDQLLAPYLSGENPDMVTLAYAMQEGDYHNPGIPKVITDVNGNAIYFSRSPIPYFTQKTPVNVFHHMGVYAFRRDFLKIFAALPESPLEKAESLEQLRAIENGYKVRLCLTEDKTLEINTPEEYQRAQDFVYED